MVNRQLKVGDIVEVTHYTLGHHAPDVKDELGTEVLFRRIVGRHYRIMGFDEHGHIELHPTRRDWIWITTNDIKLVVRKRKKRSLLIDTKKPRTYRTGPRYSRG
jgi:hypothetical protein